MKKYVFGLLTGLLISGGVVYAATLIDSKDVTYTPSDNEFDASNVETALNELYTKITTNTDELNSEVERLETELDSSNKVYYLGTGTTYNIKTLFPEIDYTKLTNGNFLVIDRNGTISRTINDTCWAVYGGYTKATISYNSSTGVASVTRGVVNNRRKKDSQASWDNQQANLTTDTYLIVGNIIQN